MRCKCGNEIDNVPEHLKDLATWICSKCTNTAPKSEQPILDRLMDDQGEAKTAVRRPRRAA